MKDTKPDLQIPSLTRRGFVMAAAGTSLMAMVPPGVRSAAWAAGSDAPEKKEVRIGFIPLTDCASVVMAAEMGFDKKYGIKIIPTKEASWASVRDKLVNGELDAAHVLYGLIYGVQMGVGGPKKDLNVLMNLNNNGQAITLAKKLQDLGVTDGASLKKMLASKPGEYTFAQTFPDRYARHVAVLLAGCARYQSDEGCEGDHRAATTNGRQHACWQYGWLLRWRAVEQPRDHRQNRFHGGNDAGYLG
jgi:hypothetical protein